MHLREEEEDERGSLAVEEAEVEAIVAEGRR